MRIARIKNLRRYKQIEIILFMEKLNEETSKNSNEMKT